MSTDSISSGVQLKALQLDLSVTVTSTAHVRRHTHACGAPYAVHESSGILRRVVLHDPVHVRDVQPPRRHVRAEQHAWRKARATPRGRLISWRSE